MKRGLSAPQGVTSYGSEPNSIEVPLSSSQEAGWRAAARPGFCQSPSLHPQPWPGAASQAEGRAKESSIVALNGGPDAKKATAALSLGRAAKRKAMVLPRLSAHPSTAAHGMEGAPLCHGGDGHGASSTQA